MNKIITSLIFIFLLLSAVGCETASNIGNKSSKRLMQEKLLYELDKCDSKFDSRTMNQEYCMELLVKIDALIRDGYFDDEGQEQAESITNTKDLYKIEQPKEDEVESAIDDIIGDI